MTVGWCGHPALKISERITARDTISISFFVYILEYISCHLRQYTQRCTRMRCHPVPEAFRYPVEGDSTITEDTDNVQRVNISRMAVGRNALGVVRSPWLYLPLIFSAITLR